MWIAALQAAIHPTSWIRVQIRELDFSAPHSASFYISKLHEDWSAGGWSSAWALLYVHRVECSIMECHFALHLSKHSPLLQVECHFNPHPKWPGVLEWCTPWSANPKGLLVGFTSGVKSIKCGCEASQSVLWCCFKIGSKTAVRYYLVYRGCNDPLATTKHSVLMIWVCLAAIIELFLGSHLGRSTVHP